MWDKRLKEEWEKNPLQVIVIGTAAALAAAKILDSLSVIRSRNAYARQVRHSVRNGR